MPTPLTKSEKTLKICLPPDNHNHNVFTLSTNFNKFLQIIVIVLLHLLKQQDYIKNNKIY
jgi:hypothetical protein